jgi:hypothetical protein
MTDICGICGAGPANFGSIYYVGVSRCGLCLDWEIDNADPLYVKSFKLLDNPGQTKGHGKGTVATDVARTLEGTVATPEPPKRMPRARLETIMSLVLKRLGGPSPAPPREPRVTIARPRPPKAMQTARVTITKK